MNKIITVYELLRLIKDGKAPKKIKWNDEVYYYAFKNTTQEDYDYQDKYGNYLLLEKLKYEYLTSIFNNKEVEILEEDKTIIEKIEIEEDIVCNKYIENEHGARCYIKTHDKIIIEKINEIIYYINRKEDK